MPINDNIPPRPYYGYVNPYQPGYPYNPYFPNYIPTYPSTDTYPVTEALLDVSSGPLYFFIEDGVYVAISSVVSARWLSEVPGTLRISTSNGFFNVTGTRATVIDAWITEHSL